MKKTVVYLLVLVMALSLTGLAEAGNSLEKGAYHYSGEGSSLEQELNQLPAFKFWVHMDGIGYGNCPVYTAPSTQAYRCANGKASVSTNSAIDEAGYVNGWLLVRYETNNGGHRVGYIPPDYIKGFQSKMGTNQFGYILATATDIIYVTDNPKTTGSAYATLDPGEPFHILAKYTYIGDWWYIECTVDGQIARGFIDRSSSSFDLGENQSDIPRPSSVSSYETMRSPLGTEYIGDIEVQWGNTGARKMVRKNADPDSDAVASVEPGKTFPCYSIKKGTTHKDWYYIWIEDESVWGWISSGYAILYK